MNSDEHRESDARLSAMPPKVDESPRKLFGELAASVDELSEDELRGAPAANDPGPVDDVDITDEDVGL